ncbi:ecotin precursor [Paraburkholderia sp. Ac-20347]|uniref:ecotin precursor n=1 Tax=Paraburkholderia sp. Ac-20347 TaxID=2703892 RepID=UPI00197FF2F1|nr:ecotin precursor [Paraburkholderia sp. Ac-20347]MBN3813376.1 ecotin precursor [Paraburkholderia sp. Ac-20347]
MRKIAAVLVLAGCVVAAGPASAHDGGGDVVGALVGGALIGAVVGAAVSGPAVYQAPVYAEPAPVAVAPVYAEPAPGGCYDQYSGRYVPCGPPQPAPPPPPYGGYVQQPGW